MLIEVGFALYGLKVFKMILVPEAQVGLQRKFVLSMGCTVFPHLLIC